MHEYLLYTTFRAQGNKKGLTESDSGGETDATLSGIQGCPFQQIADNQGVHYTLIGMLIAGIKDIRSRS
jgi:hypothetical protein